MAVTAKEGISGRLRWSNNRKAQVMDVKPARSRITAVSDAMAPFNRFFAESAWARRDPQNPRNCDFVFGNPHDMPLPGFVAALQQWSVPQNQDWFAYKQNEASACAAIAESLQSRYHVPFGGDDIFLTNGAFAAITVALAAVASPGDEVIFVSPPWFFYESLIVGAGATPVRVGIDPVTFDLDLDAIEAALTPRTRAIVVNSPHNPTGKIYPPADLPLLRRSLQPDHLRWP
jgi:aspartate aminotransferase